MQYNFGLIGFPLEHSFSQKYFNEKFNNLNLNNFSYSLFSIKNIDKLPTLIKKYNLSGLNVTAPYKKEVLKYINEIDEKTAKLNVVNLLTIKKDKEKFFIKGYNTDIIGIQATLKNYLFPSKTKVLIIGNGCSSETCQYYFESINIKYIVVCRKPIKSNHINYSELNKEIFDSVDIIINTSILGIYPEIEKFPPIPYHFISKKHLCFDLIYNPAETIFLKKSRQFTSKLINGEKMFQAQAEKSWEIWSNSII